MSDKERNDVPSQIDWLARFTSKVGLGACICEGQEISAAIDEIERLRAAVMHEADCVEVAKAEIERLTEENRRLRADLLAGRNVVNAGLTIHTLTLERDDLRRQLAEAEPDARRYRWLRNEANTARKCDPMVCIYPLDEQDLIDGDRLDVAIDAAMGLTRPAEE